MEKIKIGIVGFGNLGKGVYEALKLAEDMELVVIFTRRVDDVKKQIGDVPVISIDDLDSFCESSLVQPDVVILCGGSKEDTPVQGPMFVKCFNTVDSFDTHAEIPRYFKEMNDTAVINEHSSIISTGWDPGLFSMMRVLFASILLNGKDYTFWGPGVSQGHGDAIRTIPGVVDARQYTIPIDAAIAMVKSGSNPVLSARQKHTRDCYVVPEVDADQSAIERQIKEMPNYFADYDTTVNFISAEEMKKKHSELPHGGNVFLSATTAGYHQSMQFNLQLDSNPDFTASVMVAYARAVHKINKEEYIGAFTALDIPLAYLSPLTAEELMKKI